MSKCKQCKIEVLDETERCPLCHCVLEKTIDVENMYPDVRVKAKQWMFFSKIYLFIAISLEIILIDITLFYKLNTLYFIIPGLIMLYGYTLIRYAIIGKSNYRSKILVMTIVAILILVAIDYFAGYHGWSVNYVLPAGILFIDAGVIILMIINRKNWQSYIMLQIFMVLCSIVSLILYAVGIITNPVVSIIALNVSLILFLGTIIIGDRKARVEIKRRFHI